MIRSAKTKVGCVLLITVMALSAVGTDPGWCDCEHGTNDLEMPTISDPGCGPSCCDQSEQDNDCCCTFKDRDAEPRADGFLPQSNLNDDCSSVAQSPPESMPRTATGKNCCIEPAFTIERFPPHLCTTVLLI